MGIKMIYRSITTSQVWHHDATKGTISQLTNNGWKEPRMGDVCPDWVALGPFEGFCPHQMHAKTLMDGQAFLANDVYHVNNGWDESGIYVQGNNGQEFYYNSLVVPL